MEIKQTLKVSVLLMQKKMGWQFKPPNLNVELLFLASVTAESQESPRAAAADNDYYDYYPPYPVTPKASVAKSKSVII